MYLAKFHASKGHMEQLPELDNRFHEILYEACDSKMLEHQLRDFHAVCTAGAQKNPFHTGTEHGVQRRA